MLQDLSAIVISVSLLKSRCFCLEKVPPSVERFEVNLEKINKQANLALETTKPFPLANFPVSVVLIVQRKPAFRFILDERLELNILYCNKTSYLNSY